MGAFGEITVAPNKKGEVEILVGTIKVKAKMKDLLLAEAPAKSGNEITVKVSRQVSPMASSELNVVGKRREEALDAVATFIDAAVMNNLTEVRIVHGKGLKILSSAVQDFLRKDKRVESYRFGGFGEGENGVTIVTLK